SGATHSPPLVVTSAPHAYGCVAWFSVKLRGAVIAPRVLFLTFHKPARIWALVGGSVRSDATASSSLPDTQPSAGPRPGGTLAPKDFIAAWNSSTAGVPVMNQGKTSVTEITPSSSALSFRRSARACDGMRYAGWYPCRLQAAANRSTDDWSRLTCIAWTPALRAARHSAVKSGWAIEACAS